MSMYNLTHDLGLFPTGETCTSMYAYWVAPLFLCSQFAVCSWHQMYIIEDDGGSYRYRTRQTSLHMIAQIIFFMCVLMLGALSRQDQICAELLEPQSPAQALGRAQAGAGPAQALLHGPNTWTKRIVPRGTIFKSGRESNCYNSARINSIMWFSMRNNILIACIYGFTFI